MRARWLLALAITSAFLVTIEWYVGWGVLLRPWRELSPFLVIAPTVLLLLTHLARALRLHSAFGAPVRGRRLACFVLVLRHNLFNNLLPMRTGELSFPVLMARRFGVRPGNSIAALLWFRVLDLHSVLCFALVLLLPYASAVLVGSVAVVWLAAPWLLRRHAMVLARPVTVWLPDAARHLAEQVLQGIPGDARTFGCIQGWTLANWGLKLAVFTWVLMMFAPLAPSAALLGAIGGELTSVLPVHGIGGVGTYEAGVMAGLAAADGDPAALVGAAVNLHLFVLGVSLVAGAIAFVPWGAGRHQGHHRSNKDPDRT